MISKEELNSLAEKSWEVCTNHPLHPNGVNPHAYILGFKDAYYSIENNVKEVAIDFLLDTTGEMFTHNAKELFEKFLQSKNKQIND